MASKSQKEIEKKIEELKGLQDKIRPNDMFGGSNTDKLEAVIKALEDDMDEDDIYEEWDVDEDDSLYDIMNIARNAVEWRDGDSEDDPAEGWPLEK